MAVAENVVQTVVAEISERLKDADFVQVSVGSFVEAQPHISRFLSAKAGRLGGAQALVHLVFHAEVLRACIERSRAQSLPLVEFSVLDRASQGDFKQTFAEREPSLASYVASNVEEEALRGELCRVGMALCLSVEP